jgi:hypothetical protein
MSSKRIKCPVCETKISFLFEYIGLINTKYTGSNCRTILKWHSKILLLNLVQALIFFGLFLILRDYIIPSKYSIIVAALIATIIRVFLPRKVIIHKKV